MLEFQNFIDGKFRASDSGHWLDVYEPATGQVYARVVASQPSDVEAAVLAAKSAFPKWSRTTARDRAAMLRKLASGIAERVSEFSTAETRNTGKPLKLSSTVDIPRAIHNFEFFADAATQFASESHWDPGVAVNYTLRQPLGVVGCISPWNLPLYLFTWKVAPALAAGNTVVAKPSEITPHTAWLLSQVMQQTGFPPGVLNIVHGTGAACGDAIVQHRQVQALSFTGSTAVGRSIAEKAGRALKKVSLELGGKNAFVVFEDCDWDKMMATAVRAAFSNQGQICLAASRFLIQQSVYDRFVCEFIEKVQKLKQGDPMQIQTEQGAVVSRAHYQKILAAIARAVEEGARVLCGGKVPTMAQPFENGWFVAPTVLEGLAMSSETCTEEIFGPVVSLHSFSTEQEAIALANQSQYGLSASLWTRDSRRVLRASEATKTGIVWVNCWMQRDLRTPFGGTQASGLGREGGWEAMRFFTEPKNVCIAEE